MLALYLLGYLVASVAVMTQKKFRIRNVLLLLAGLVLGTFAPILFPVAWGLLAIGKRNDRAIRRHQERVQHRANVKRFRAVIEDCNKKTASAKEFQSMLQARDLVLIVDRDRNGERNIMVRQSKSLETYSFKRLFNNRNNPFNDRSKFTEEFLTDMENSIKGIAPQKREPGQAQGVKEENPQLKIEVQQKEARPMEITALRDRNADRTVYILPDALKNSSRLELIREQLDTLQGRAFICFESDKQKVLEQCGLTDALGTRVKSSDFLKEKVRFLGTELSEVSWSGNPQVLAAHDYLTKLERDIDANLASSVGSERAMQFRDACTVTARSQREFDLVVNGETLARGTIQDDGNIRMSYPGSDSMRFQMAQKGVDVREVFRDCEQCTPEAFAGKCDSICSSESNIAAAKQNYEYIQQRQQKQEQERQERQEQENSRKSGENKGKSRTVTNKNARHI